MIRSIDVMDSNLRRVKSFLNIPIFYGLWRAKFNRETLINVHWTSSNNAFLLASQVSLHETHWKSRLGMSFGE